MASWWPLETHSVGQERSQSVVFEGRRGGRITRSSRVGRRRSGGRSPKTPPPRRVAFTWHPGREPDSAQTLEVRFSAVDDGTRVDLVHDGWERFGEGAREMRDEYDRGWTYVLGPFSA